MGVNDDDYDPMAHTVVSNASCTTNCLAPMARVLDERFGIAQGFMTTVHAYTSDQALLDQPRSGRKAICAVCARRPFRSCRPRREPVERWAKCCRNSWVDSTASRCECPSLSAPSWTSSRPSTAERPDEEVNEAFAIAAHDKSYRGVLEYTEKPLVSSDIVGNPASCVFSARDTMASGRVVKVLGWYDNEWGYANRLVDLVELIGELKR